MVTAVDDAVERILTALRAAGVRGETPVMFTSDHGPSREVRNHLDGSDTRFEGGSTGGLCGAKVSLFEGGIRVPGIVDPPAGVAAGAETSDAFVAGTDAVPTVPDCCSLAPDGDVDGTSLAPALDGAGDARAGDPVAPSDGEYGTAAAVGVGDRRSAMGRRRDGVRPGTPTGPGHARRREDGAGTPSVSCCRV